MFKFTTSQKKLKTSISDLDKTVKLLKQFKGETEVELKRITKLAKSAQQAAASGGGGGSG